MSVDMLGTNCDRCPSTVQCCFTSTETVRLVRTEGPDGHLDSHTQLLSSDFPPEPVCMEKGFATLRVNATQEVATLAVRI